jgi:hypothetical protein
MKRDESLEIEVKVMRYGIGDKRNGMRNIWDEKWGNRDTVY